MKLNGLRIRILGIAILLLIFCFQNCLGLGSSGQGSGSSIVGLSGNMSGGGNGQAYDKLVYATYAKLGPCADGSPFESEIDLVAGTATLVRQNCQAIPSAQQTQVSYTIDPGNEFLLTYNGIQYYEVYWDGLRGLAQDSNQNMFIVGSGGTDKQVPGVPVRFNTISKLSPNGQVIWSNFAPESLSIDGSKVLPNGNIVLAGSTSVTNANGLSATGPFALLMMDPAGNVLWSRTYNLVDQTVNATWTSSIDVDSSGSIYVAGSCSMVTGASAIPIGPPPMISAFFIMKFDSQGSIIWRKYFSDDPNTSSPPTTTSTVGGFVRLSPQGDVYAAGSSVTIGGFVMKLSVAGDVLASAAYQAASASGSGAVSALDFSPSGGLILTGLGASAVGSSSASYIAAVAADGSVQWSENVSDGSSVASVYLPSVAADGSLYVTEPDPSLGQQTPGKEGRIVRLSSTGFPQSEILFSGSTVGSSVVSPVSFAANGTMWAVATRSYSVHLYIGIDGTISRYGLVKLNPALSAPCATCSTVTNLTATPVSIVTGPGPTLQPMSLPTEVTGSSFQFTPNPVPIPLY